MSGFPSPGHYVRARNGPPISQPHNGHNVVRHEEPADLESHYTNPYSEHHVTADDRKHHKNGNKMAIHRPRLNRKDEEKTRSSLTTNFDPMKDRHMWAMWRTAVNGRIVDQVRRNEQSKYDIEFSEDVTSAAGDNEARAIAYGKDLTSVPPLSRFIRLNQKSKDIAQGLMNEGQGKLETTQFIYYGLPRVTVNTGINSRNNNNNNLNGDIHLGKEYSDMNVYNGEDSRMQSL